MYHKKEVKSVSLDTLKFIKEEIARETLTNERKRIAIELLERTNLEAIVIAQIVHLSLKDVLDLRNNKKI